MSLETIKYYYIARKAFVLSYRIRCLLHICLPWIKAFLLSYEMVDYYAKQTALSLSKLLSYEMVDYYTKQTALSLSKLLDVFFKETSSIFLPINVQLRLPWVQLMSIVLNVYRITTWRLERASVNSKSRLGYYPAGFLIVRWKKKGLKEIRI